MSLTLLNSKDDLLPVQDSSRLSAVLNTIEDRQDALATATQLYLWKGPARQIETVEVFLGGLLDDQVADETLTVVVSKRTRAGVVSAVATFTLTPASGQGFIAADAALTNVAIAPGDYIQVARTYVAGTVGLNPPATVFVQGRNAGGGR